jgi:hypothetical protein
MEGRDMADTEFTTADIRQFFAYCEQLGPGACVDPGAELFEFMASYPWSDRYLRLYTRTEAACAEFGHPYGFNPWLLSSIDAFSAEPRLLVMGLNPAGSRDYPEHRGRYLYENGNAYFHDWEGAGWSPLQKQMQRLFAELQQRVGDTRDPAEFARTGIVTGSLVPFRSPGGDSLHRAEESLAFGRELWGEVFAQWMPQAAVTFGETPFEELSRLLGRETNKVKFPSGWGRTTLTLREFDNGSRLLGLPHLSRYKIFGRAQGAAGIEAAFDALLAGGAA